MKPCDCKDAQDVKKLDHEGIYYNDRGITVNPNSVIIEVGSCKLRVWQKDFERWAKWYLEDQVNIASKVINSFNRGDRKFNGKKD